jgi:uncharacterized protein (TIGR02597 family)
MKLNLSFLTGAASLAALLSGAIADSAVTDPVGYVTVNLAGGSAAAPGVSVVGPALVKEVSYAGTVTAKPGAKQLQFAANSFTVNAFNGTAPNFKFWIELTNGSGTVMGMWTDVVSNTTDTITTNDDLNALVTAGTTTVKIRGHQTVASFLGATNSAGLVAGPELGAADTVVFIDPVTQNQTVVFFSNDPDAPGWLDAVGADHSGDIIAPGQGVIIRHRADAGVGKQFTVVGHVKTGQTIVAAEAGNNVICPPLATGVTIGNSGLSPVVTQGTELGAADNVVFYQNGLSSVVFLSNDPDAPGWQNAVGTDFTSTLLTETSAFLLKNFVAPTPFNVTFPAQTIAP